MAEAVSTWRVLARFVGQNKLALILSATPLWKLAYQLLDAIFNFQSLFEFLKQHPDIWRLIGSWWGAIGLMLIGFMLLLRQVRKLSQAPQRTPESATAEVSEDAYLDRKLKEQQYGIEHFVEIRNLTVFHHDLNSENPHIDFKVFISSRSIYPLSIDDLNGSIKFDGHLLSENPLLLPEPGGDLNFTHDTRFIIRQKLTKGDVTRIVNSPGEFDFMEASIRIFSASYDLVAPRRLFLQRRWSKVPVSNAEILAAHPKLEFTVKSAGYTWLIDMRDFSSTSTAIVTIELDVVNHREHEVLIDKFKLGAVIKGNQYNSFAETNELLWPHRFIDKNGKLGVRGKELVNLNQHMPITALQDVVIEGRALQFIINTAVGGTPWGDSQYKGFTVVAIDKSGETHTVNGTLAYFED